MGLFLTSFLVIALAGLGMGLGVLLGRRPLAGTCGGLNALGEEGCALCGDQTRRCPKAPACSEREAR